MEACWMDEICARDSQSAAEKEIENTCFKYVKNILAYFLSVGFAEEGGGES